MPLYCALSGRSSGDLLRTALYEYNNKCAAESYAVSVIRAFGSEAIVDMGTLFFNGAITDNDYATIVSVCMDMRLFDDEDEMRKIINLAVEHNAYRIMRVLVDREVDVSQVSLMALRRAVSASNVRVLRVLECAGVRMDKLWVSRKDVDCSRDQMELVLEQLGVKILRDPRSAQ